jgi:hypothetical protein
MHFWFDHNNTATNSSPTKLEAKTPESTSENTLSELGTTTTQESIIEESNSSLVTNGLSLTQSSNTASTESTTEGFNSSSDSISEN